jgi:hypothetical protein
MIPTLVAVVLCGVSMVTVAVSPLTQPIKGVIFVILTMLMVVILASAFGLPEPYSNR